MSNDSNFVPLTEEDQKLFDSYKDAIFIRLREKFPDIPSNFDLKPFEILRQLGCGTFYTYKIGLPNNEVADVNFHLGGKRATPLVGPPHFEITKN